MVLIHKLTHFIEFLSIFLLINWQPFFGFMSAAAATVYYLSILKMNVVDVKYEGSWKGYVKSIFKRKKNKQ